MNNGRTKMETSRAFSFGPFHLLPIERLLLEGEKPLRIGSRALEILIVLVERHGELVARDELMARVWPNLYVEPSNLTVHITALRRILGDGLNGQRYLLNIPGRGYRFVATVAIAEKDESRSAQRSSFVAHRNTYSGHAPSAHCVDTRPMLAGRQEAWDPTRFADTRGLDCNRCTNCPLLKTCFYN